MPHKIKEQKFTIEQNGMKQCMEKMEREVNGKHIEKLYIIYNLLPLHHQIQFGCVGISAKMGD